MKKKAKNWKSDFDIPFSGLKLGMHHFDFEVKQAFFEYYDFEEFREADLYYKIEMEKKNTMLVLQFQLSGDVEVDCDLSLEAFRMPLESEWQLIVKLGSEYRDEDDGVVIIPAEEHHFNIANYLYEMAVLAMPRRKIHPKVESGELQSEILEKLRDYQIEEVSEDDMEEVGEDLDKPVDETDPRWQKLKDLYKGLN